MKRLTSLIRMMTGPTLDLRPIAGGAPEGGGGEGGEGGGGGGEGGEGGGKPAGEGKPEAGSEAGSEGGETKTFNQDDVDRIVRERLARDRKDRPSDDEIAELRDKAKKHDDAEAANQSELDKEKQRADTAEEQAQKATETAHDTLRRAEIIAAAVKHKAVNPDAVHALIKDRGFKLKDGENELSVTVGDDGQVTGAEEVVKAFLEADENEYLVGSTPSPGPGDGGARKTPSGALTKEALQQMSPEQVAKLDQKEVDKALSAGG